MFKIIFRLIIFCPVGLATFNSCKKHRPDIEAPGSISLSKTVIAIDSVNGSNDTLIVYSTVAWRATISPGANWLQIDQSSGAPGNTSVKISIATTPITSLSATITFTATNNPTVPAVTLTINIRSYNLNVNFRKAFGGTKYESTGRNSMARTPDGGLVIAATTNSLDGDVPDNNRGGYDMWLMKLNANGQIVWSKTFGGSGDDEASSVIVSSTGDIEVAGSTNSLDGDVTGNHGGVGSDAWILKLNGNGELIWSKVFGGTSDDAARAIAQTADGGSVVAGHAASTNGDVHGNRGSADVWVIRLNAEGDTLWTATYGGSSFDEAGHIVVTPDGGVALSGLTYSNDGDVVGYHTGQFPGADVWVVKLNAAGQKVWAKTFGGSADDVGQSIIAAPGGGYMIAAYATSNDGDITGHHGNTSFNDIWLAKLDNDGNKIWSKSYGGNLDDVPTALIADTDGGYVIAGGTDSHDGDLAGNQGADLNMYVIKINSAGNIIWSKKFGSSGDDVFYSVVADSNGSYLLAGVTDTNDGDISGSGYHGDYDIWIARMVAQ